MSLSVSSCLDWLLTCLATLGPGIILVEFSYPGLEFWKSVSVLSVCQVSEPGPECKLNTRCPASLFKHHLVWVSQFLLWFPTTSPASHQDRIWAQARSCEISSPLPFFFFSSQFLFPALDHASVSPASIQKITSLIKPWHSTCEKHHNQYIQHC